MKPKENYLKNNAVNFADWIAKKGYKLIQMNYSNNGAMWFLNKYSIGLTTNELYEVFNKQEIEKP